MHKNNGKFERSFFTIKLKEFSLQLNHKIHMWMNFPALNANMLCSVNALVSYVIKHVQSYIVIYLYEGHREEYLSGN